MQKAKKKTPHMVSLIEITKKYELNKVQTVYLKESLSRIYLAVNPRLNF